MLKYLEKNVNPKNKKTSDCSTRALSVATGMSWDAALTAQYEESLKTGYGITERKVMENILAKCGFVKMKQPRKYDNTKYEVREMDKIIGVNSVAVLNVAHHYVAVIGDSYIDTWNSGSKTVGNYYIKLN